MQNDANMANAFSSFFLGLFPRYTFRTTRRHSYFCPPMGKLQGKIISIDQQFFVIFLGSSCFHLLPAGWHFHSQWTDPIGVPLGSGNSFQRLRAWFNSMRSDQFGCVDITQVPVARWWAAESAFCELWIQGI